MECKEAYSLMDGYIQDKLSRRELEAFIEHILSCEECYRETETSFMIDSVLQELNDSTPESDNLDFEELLRKKIDLQKSQLERYEDRSPLHFIVCAGMLLSFLLMVLNLFGINLISDFLHR